MKIVNLIFLVSFLLPMLSQAQINFVNSIAPVYFKMPQGIHQEQFLENTVLFRLKDEYKSRSNGNIIDIDELKSFFKSIDVNELEQKYPDCHPVNFKSVAVNGEKIDLTLIYEFKYNSNVSLETVINKLFATGYIKYANPHYVPQLLYVPNDNPKIDSVQWGLKKISAFAGWDISKGDTNVVIGIVDAGIQLDHPDLKDNIKNNYADPIDNIDNDKDGYTDNFRGWDVALKNNNPTAVKVYHGIHVSGISSATADNGKGIAGAGFKCKFLPVKVIDKNGILSASYDGIVYAANHGCSIINCSWGDSIYPGQYAQEIINYVTFTKNALVVAAAGNKNNSTPYFPASLEHVLSVAATDSKDVKSAISSYGNFVDVSAPGDKIYSTWGNSGYLSSGATSMAAPFASGLAAIVKSYFPSYQAVQIAEQLKVTSDLIDTVSGNSAYKYKLGAGRINLYRALTQTTLSSVNLIADSLPVYSYGLFVKNDTMKFTPYFINYLAPATNVNVKITSASPYVQIIDTDISLGSISTMGIKKSPKQIKIRLLDNIPSNYFFELKFSITDNQRTNNQYVLLFVNTDILNIQPNDIATSLTSKGNIGFNDFDMNHGWGLHYKSGNNLLACGGLIVGNASNRVSDNIYRDSVYTNEFLSLDNVRQVYPSTHSDYEFHNKFNDDLAGANKLNIEIVQNTYAWINSPDSKYIICEYVIQNKSSSAISNFYAGFYSDWEIIDTANRNRCGWDSDTKLGYTFSIDNGLPYAGVALLTPTPYRFYAIDNDGSAGSVRVWDDFSDASKYMTLSTDRLQSGMGANGNDVSQVVSAGPFNLEKNQSKKIAFVILAGDNLTDLKNSVHAAQNKYHADTITSLNTLNNVSGQLDLQQNKPNPFNGNTSVNIYLPEEMTIDLSVIDMTGNKVFSITKGNYPKGNYRFDVNMNLPAGIYFCRLETSGQTITRKMLIVN